MNHLQQALVEVRISSEETQDFGSEETINDVLRHCYLRHNGAEAIPFLRAELKALSQQLSSSITRDWARLKNALEQCGSTIKTRWRQKSPAGRKELLLQAWPNMPAEHGSPRIQLDHWALSATHNTSDQPRVPDACMFPEINLEDLGMEEVLLVFLDARARVRPHNFALSDTLLARDLLAKQVLQARWPCAAMTFTGTNPDRDYGCIIECIGNAQYANQMEWNGKGVTPGEGFIILYFQEKVYAFLFRCYQLLLQDTALYSLVPHLPTRPEQPSPLDDFQHLKVLGPYQARQGLTMDLNALQQLVSKLRDRITRHIWQLREDPTYFAEQVETALEHREELIPDSLGNVLPLPTRDILCGLVCDAYADCTLLDDLQKTISSAARALAPAPPAVTPAAVDTESGLPQEYMTGTLQASYVLFSYQANLSARLWGRFLTSPQVRSHVSRATNPDRIVTDRLCGAAGPLPAALRYITSSKSTVLTQHEAIDAFEALCRRSQDTAVWLSPSVQSILIDLSIASEGLWQFRLCSLWRKIHMNVVKNTETFRSRTAAMMNWIKSYRTDHRRVPDPGLGDPSEGKFSVPTLRNQKRTKKFYDAQRAAEAHLDAFWTSIDQSFETITGKAHAEPISSLLASRTLQRTSPPRNRQKAEPVSPRSVPVLVHNPKPLSPEARTGPPPKYLRSEQTWEVPKKQKTRGQGDGRDVNWDAAVQEDANDVRDTDADAPRYVFRVPVRDFTIFKALFFIQGETDVPGNVRWDDVVRALTEIGFSARHAEGSAWEFDPIFVPDTAFADDNPRSRITFHAPHPQPSIPLNRARELGRRLREKYGWTGRIFELRG